MAAEAAGSAVAEVAKAEGSSTRDAAVAAATATGMEATAGRRGLEAGSEALEATMVAATVVVSMVTAMKERAA